MDDFNVSSLHESKNEWGARLLVILTPLIIEGFKFIFDESYKLCKENGEKDKYLMTFQNFISRVPKWNATIIENEKKRIIEKSCCSYLEDLVTCIHIIQLKLLTSMRVGKQQKKIDINIPKLDDFIHKIYINVARKIYKNVYLYELNVTPLQIQKNNRELEMIVQECILNTVRESIPVESIIRAYMDETVEDDVVEEIKEQIIDPEAEKKATSTAETINELKTELDSQTQTSTSTQIENNNIQNDLEKNNSLKFNDIDSVINHYGKEELITAPKTIERLEEISALRNMQRKQDEDEDGPINILNEDINLDTLDIQLLTPLETKNNHDILLDDIEILA